MWLRAHLQTWFFSYFPEYPHSTLSIFLAPHNTNLPPLDLPPPPLAPDDDTCCCGAAAAWARQRHRHGRSCLRRVLQPPLWLPSCCLLALPLLVVVCDLPLDRGWLHSGHRCSSSPDALLLLLFQFGLLPRTDDNEALHFLLIPLCVALHDDLTEQLEPSHRRGPRG
ncbi:hypothetical protein GUJ93_ZPchr0003g16969 [Zizania palustris]|uniref:Uncharacterized protein n=1 Tax=Zizania palustris TaxID=103762 RepID=A0A8J5VD32_ZIZPA|nr:hypothetical protein GUJ93_ZPchr0003g16969 [Zizania palustris]